MENAERRTSNGLSVQVTKPLLLNLADRSGKASNDPDRWPARPGATSVLTESLRNRGWTKTVTGNPAPNVPDGETVKCDERLTVRAPPEIARLGRLCSGGGQL